MPCHSPARRPFIVEEADDVARDLSKTGVERLRADLHEHVTHVLDQDQLSPVTRSLEVSIEFDRLRFEDFCVVDSLNKKDGGRVRSNVGRGAGTNEVSMIILAKDLLSA